MKRAVVCGAGGFIASHLVTRLKRDGYWVRGVDLKHPEFSASNADDFRLLDLRELDQCREAVRLDPRFAMAHNSLGATLADGDGPFPDPVSRFQPEGVHGPSEVVDPSAFAWNSVIHAALSGIAFVVTWVAVTAGFGARVCPAHAGCG